MKPTAALVVLALLPTSLGAGGDTTQARSGDAIKAPEGPVTVAFLLSEGATMIDFTGPWEVFQDANPAGREGFRLYTVAETTAPIRATGGMKIVPDYSISNAPAPNVIVIPAQSAPSAAVREWLKRSAETADVVMSVCTGAFVLASTGLLDGQAATTHHDFYGAFERRYPKVSVQRGKRFVEGPKFATAGGLTSGMDLALRVVERYFGRETAERTAYYMEYQSAGWRDATGAANAEYAASAQARPGETVCPVCGMSARAGEFSTEHGGHAYHFCSEACRTRFLADPELYANGGGQTMP